MGLINESRRLKLQQKQLHEKHQQEMQIDTDNHGNVGDNSNNSNSEEDISITTCPVCQRYDITGIEIVPLSFVELDKARHLLMMAHAGLLKKRMAVGNGMIIGGSSSVLGDAAVVGSGGGSGGSAFGGGSDSSENTSTVATTSSTTVTTSATPPSSSSTSQFYDPSMPRTGRWTEDELAFRDALVTHFDAGSLPLSNGIKLNDFLSSMLKSKQSRLTKKMKHAKLSSKYFRIQSGYLMRERDSSCGNGGVTGGGAGGACTFSNLEYNFIHSIADPIERSEIAFHMQREWREHVAERLTYLRINFDATSWLRSVDSMERRVALEKNRSRLAKRRNLMGKAMEKDVSENMPGVFINQRVDDIAEVVGSDVKIRRIGDYDGGGRAEIWGSSSNTPQAAGGSVVASSEGQHDEDGELSRFLMSMLDEAPISTNTTIGAIHHDDDIALMPSSMGGKKSNSTLRSSCDPNFRYAAPFLAGITSYMERHGVPFEHVDIWVPSVVPPALERELSTLFIGSMGSGSNPTNTSSPGSETCLDEAGDKKGVFRLCFAGSATLGVQIVDQSSLDSLSIEDDAQKKENTSPEMNIYPLTGDEIYNFSLFGQYSSKFSFSSGCGLPGRVFQSGIAAWEQFVANAPPEMFERRGGAIQFGIKTSLGLPIDCETVGRIVLVLYSKHNREKDEELVNRMVKDVRLFNPCPRWKLVVDMGVASDPSRVSTQPPPQPVIGSSIGAPPVADSSKNDEIMSLVTLLQEFMPSDQQSLLGPQLNSMMLLRMTLLRTNRTPEKEQLIDMMLVLFKSYIAAGRTRQDIATLLTRDYDFHILQLRNQVSSQPQPMDNTAVTSQMVQQGALLQRLSMSNRINPRHFQSEVSPTTIAAPPGTFSPPFEMGGFPSTPFT